MKAQSVARILKTLSERVRLRLLAILARQELTVTELTECLNLGQPRISGHLARLAEEGLVETRREGRFVFYAAPKANETETSKLANSILERFSDSDEALADARSVKAVLARRTHAAAPESIGRDYLPGRTWEGLAKALLCVQPLGRIADLGIGRGEMSILLAESAEHVIGVDHDAAALSAASSLAEKAGLAKRMSFRLGDAADPPIARGEVDLWMLSQVLHELEDPQAALVAARSRLLQGGRVLVLDLLAHREAWVEARLGHRHLGFSERELGRLLRRAGFADVVVKRVARDRKPPHFVSILGTGRKP